ncbi:hypothetical protein V8E55_010527 [Tylopilus felleus]
MSHADDHVEHLIDACKLPLAEKHPSPIFAPNSLLKPVTMRLSSSLIAFVYLGLAAASAIPTFPVDLAIPTFPVARAIPTFPPEFRERSEVSNIDA